MSSLASVLWCLQIFSASALHAIRFRSTEPKHYLSFSVVGDLTNAWECIINAGIVAARMKDMTLVIPNFGQLRHSENKFSDVYDVDAFKSAMHRIGVDVVDSVPDGVEEVSVDTVPDADMNGYAAEYGKVRGKYSTKPVHLRITHNIGYGTYQSRQLQECRAKYDLCDDVAASLVFTSRLRGLARRAADLLRGGGDDWLAVHLHDFTPFLCEKSMEGELKRVKWRLDEHKLGNRRLYVIGGLEDLGMVASATGVSEAKVFNKNVLLGEDVAKLGFQQKAAVDFMVGLEANTYMPKRGSSFDDLIINMRELSGRQGNIISLPDTDCVRDEARMAAEKAAKEKA